MEWNFFRRNVINCTIGANCTFYYQMGDSTLFCPVYSCVYWKHRKIMTTKNKSPVLTRNYGILSCLIRKSRFYRLSTRFSQSPRFFQICIDSVGVKIGSLQMQRACRTLGLWLLMQVKVQTLSSWSHSAKTTHAFYTK